MSQEKFRKSFDQKAQGDLTQTNHSHASRSYKDSFEGDVEYDLNFVEVTPYKVDESLHKWFDEDMPIMIRRSENAFPVKTPIIWSSAERWNMISRHKETRDRNGQLILPILSIKRSDIETLWERTVAVDKDGTTNFRLYVHEYFNTQTNKKSYVLQTQKDTKVPIVEIIEIQPPKIVKFQYDVTFWSDYMEDLNVAVNHMITQFGNKHATYINENLFFGARLESMSNNSNDEQIGQDERIFKTNFTIVIEAPIITQDSIRRYKTPQGVDVETNVTETIIDKRTADKIRDQIMWHDRYRINR